MDSCVRNLGLVPNLAAVSTKDARAEMSDWGRLRPALPGEVSDAEVLCPKPRRVAGVTFSTLELLKPVRQRRSMQSAGVDCEAGHEILEIILCKNSNALGSSPPYFSGSPPSRAGNPLVRDAEFSHHRRILPAGSQSKSSTGPSFRLNPSVRVEGFECSGRGFDCTGRDARCQVTAFA